MNHILLIHSSVDAHLGSFHVLAIVNSFATKMGVHILQAIFLFFEISRWSEHETYPMLCDILEAQFYLDQTQDISSYLLISTDQDTSKLHVLSLSFPSLLLLPSLFLLLLLILLPPPLLFFLHLLFFSFLCCVSFSLVSSILPPLCNSSYSVLSLINSI